MKIYLGGSLRNPLVPQVAAVMRSAGFEVFDEWFSGGEHADEAWRSHMKLQELTLPQALKRSYAQHIFEYDKGHLDSSDAMVLLLPAGRSAHLELGYMVGKGKPTIIQIDNDPDRYDVMYLFADWVTTSTDETLRCLRGFQMMRRS